MAKVFLIIKKVNQLGFILSAILLMFMGLAVSYDVLMRYFIGKPTIWVNEISGYILVVTTFMAAGYTLKEGGHIKVDFLENKTPPLVGYILFIFSHLIMLFFMIVITWQGYKMASMSFNLNWTASTLLGTPLYIPQLFIPLGGALFSLQAIVQMIERTIKYKEESR
jgi:C4-dicarboxylate transporter, DctQ subunit